MCSKAVEGRFVTYVMVIIDLNTHEMSLVNAGHMSPMIRRVDGTVEEFDEERAGVPIGVIEGYPYEVDRRIIEPGETIVIYTDGVSEAMNPDSELYGLERLREFIRTHSPNPTQLGRAILADVTKHAAGRPQNDDITLMSFGRLPI
jgi:serine phosphatase RsbU (regulator of sigma subunit)